MESWYIAFSQVMMDVLPFVGLTKEIEFVIKLQQETLKILFSIFDKPVMVHEYIQGVIALAVAPQTQSCTKHIAMKYYYSRNFSQNMTWV